MDLVTPRIRSVLDRLEREDEAERRDGVAQELRLRALAPEVGPVLVTLALAIDAHVIVEVGTSGGYSTLWLAVAARRTSGNITTFDFDPVKAERARRNFAAADAADLIDTRVGDGGEGLAGFRGRADLVFIDAEKEDYVRLLEPAIAALRPGGLLIADNLTSHAVETAEFRALALAHPRLSGFVAPIGGGELIAVRL